MQRGPPSLALNYTTDWVLWHEGCAPWPGLLGMGSSEIANLVSPRRANRTAQ
jgi:hypothetical protein